MFNSAHCSALVFLTDNVAIGKPATQRDVHEQVWPAGNAVDGKTNGQMFNGHCMHTGEDPDSGPAWWTVDLLDLYYIEKVTVHNRQDCCEG